MQKNVRGFVQRVAGIKFRTYGLPITVSSKDDVRDILVSLGWPVRLELTLEEIKELKTSASACLKIVEICLVPHTSSRRHFICIRIRKPVIQADCVNTPICLIKYPELGKRKREPVSTTTTSAKKTSLKEPTLKKTRLSAAAKGKKT